MQLKTLLESDDAVSPVIGVILMVAITVILAAVIGTFVLGLGDQVQQTSPNAQFAIDYDSADPGNLTITHEGGESVPTSTINISVSDTQSADYEGSHTWNDLRMQTGTQITAGDQAQLNQSNPGTGTWNDGEFDEATVRVIWQSEGGGSSATLKEWTGPDA